MDRYSMVFLPGYDERTEDVLKNLYRRITAHKIERALFYNGHVSEQDFIDLLTDNEAVPFVTCRNDEIVLLFWLNSWKGKSARLHFTMFPESWGDRKHAYQLGTKALRLLLSLRQKEDEHLVDTIIGVTPTSNRLACRYALNTGLQKVGIIPHSDFNIYTEQLEDTMLTLGTREIMHMSETEMEPVTWEW